MDDVISLFVVGIRRIIESKNGLTRTLLPDIDIRRRIVIPMLLSLLLAIFIFRKTLFTPGVPQFGDFVFNLDPQWIRSRFMTTWNPFFSADTGPDIGFYPYYLWLLFFGNTETCIKLLLLTNIMFVAFVAFQVTYSFVSRIVARPLNRYLASSMACLVSVFNPWVVTRFSHYPYFWVISSAFLILYFVDKAINQSSIRSLLKHTLAASIPFLLVSGFVYNLILLFVFTACLLFLEICFGELEVRKKLRNTLIFIVVLTPILAGFFAYEALPLFGGGLAFTYSSQVPWIRKLTIGELDWIWRNSNVVNSFWLSNYWAIHIELYHEVGLIRTFWFSLTFILPAIALSAVFIKPRDRIVRLLLWVVIIFIGLTSAPFGPLREIYIKLMDTYLFSSLLRSPDKFTPFLIVAYVILGGITLGRTLEKVDKRRYKRVFKYLIVVMISASISIGAYPALSGDVQGQFQPIEFPSSYAHARDWLKEQQGEFRVFWFPTEAKVSWAPKGSLLPDLRKWMSPKPVFMPAGETYDKILENFISHTLKYGGTSRLGKVLAMCNTRFLVYHDDIEETGKEVYKDVLKNLLKQQDLTLVFKDANIYIFENQEWKDRFAHAVNKFTVIIGGMDTLTLLLETGAFDPMNSAVVFVEQKPYSLDDLKTLTRFDTVFIFSNRKLADLVLSVVGDKYYHTPYNSLKFLETNWQGDMSSVVWFGIYGISGKVLPEKVATGRFDFDYGKGFIWTDKPTAEFKLPFEIRQDDKYEVWIRLYVSPQEGHVLLKINDEKIGQLSTDSEESIGFKWFKVHKLPLNNGSHSFSITNVNGTNIVNLIAVIPSDQVERTFDEIESLLEMDNVAVLYDRPTDIIGPVLGSKYKFDDIGMWVSESGEWDNGTLRVISDTAKWDVIDDKLHFTGPPYYQLITLKNVTLSDGVAEAEVMVPAPNTGVYLAFRVQDIANLYIFGIVPWQQALDLSKFVNGTQTRILHIEYPIESNKWYNLRVQFTGGLLRGSIDGRTAFVLVDDTFRSGRVGFWAYGREAFFYTLGVRHGEIALHPGKANQSDLSTVLASSELLFVKKIERLSHTKYSLEVDASTPHILVFSEKYHDLWEAVSRDDKMDKIIIYSAYNGFLSSRSDSYNVTIKFEPEEHLHSGLIISSATLFLTLCFIVVLQYYKVPGNHRQHKQKNGKMNKVGVAHHAYARQG